MFVPKQIEIANLPDVGSNRLSSIDLCSDSCNGECRSNGRLGMNLGLQRAMPSIACAETRIQCAESRQVAASTFPDASSTDRAPMGTRPSADR